MSIDPNPNEAAIKRLFESAGRHADFILQLTTLVRETTEANRMRMNFLIGHVIFLWVYSLVLGFAVFL